MRWCQVPLVCARLTCPRGCCFSVGFSFDLSPLTKKDGYKVETAKYDFYINVCAAVTMGACQPGSGACQVARRQVSSQQPRGFLGDRCLFRVRCALCIQMLRRGSL